MCEISLPTLNHHFELVAGSVAQDCGYSWTVRQIHLRIESYHHSPQFDARPRLWTRSHMMATEVALDTTIVSSTISSLFPQLTR